ncbi:hypothetical protein WR25_14816 [Diploscapter pachys]|uniref:BPTI/Kunitz inhibitor domain-containing protein n=1 Tax=Diploscapter pachys TaxID=2018661 RepID=A0A2A2KMI6_9BILA|nr:hypothetical protein WR25_14816 [Diploscapter pachys]
MKIFNYDDEFLGDDTCEERCGPNPCFEGRPFTGADGRPQTCSASANLNTCPSSYWCHIGVDMSTTVCCPGASTNVCNLPMSTGEGNSNLERYYFDQQSKACRPFVYNGLKGNQNNFISLRACQLACQPLDNPCIGQPAVTAAGQVLFCSATNKDTCPVNFWCHVGATPETTVCCPGATNPCSVPLSPGTGNAGLPRYYYNPDDRQCLPFQYNGKRGNQNNFLSQTECERTCPVFTNPCLGEVIRDELGNPLECDPFRKSNCGESAFCLPTNNQSYCCPRLNQDYCNSLITSGIGTSNLTRYYYNPIEELCLPFEFKGMHGNENNFITKTVCEEHCAPLSNVCFGGESPLVVYGKIIQCQTKACPPTHYCHLGFDHRSTVCCKRQGSPCDQQLMTGVGTANLPRFYYDSFEDQCEPFNYTGIGGNENNFVSLSECQVKCPGYRDFCPHGRPLLKNSTFVTCGIDTFCPKGYICHVSNRDAKNVCCPDPVSFCALNIEPGPCSGSQRRFAYDKNTGACKKFSYGGCEGNLNNFDSLEKCTKKIDIFPEELCLLSIDRGACGGRQTRYAFNRQSSQCVPFEYTGCGGNLNNFVSMQDCMATCGNVGFRR